MKFGQAATAPCHFPRCEMPRGQGGIELIREAYAKRDQRFAISPATMMRLLLLRRRPTPEGNSK